MLTHSKKPELGITVGHRTLSEHIMKMSSQFQFMIGLDDRISHQHILSYLLQGVANCQAINYVRSRGWRFSKERKSRKLFGRENPFVKLGPAYSVKLVFSCVAKG